MVMTRWGDGMGRPPPSPAQKKRYDELRASGMSAAEARRIARAEFRLPER